MQNNPIIDLPPSRTVNRLNAITLIIILGTYIYLAFVFPGLPEEVPIHFNFAGEADHWGNKAFILIFPLIFTIILLPLHFLQRTPYMHNYPVKVTDENASRLYQLGRLLLAVMNVEMALLMALITWAMVQSSKGYPLLNAGIMIAFLILPLVTTLVFIIKMIKSK
ncbi:DUF1648 domain-containing protein [Virgibacillus sp. MSP4-1]|uniref:DUF1648 domain-containing protein n=1 Tax=Virgibacillus sp. MSP4-1 TaxID=2700081 RepID=UPI00069439F6|nr:DUF1648 domain-containing protein [Virgibacillus sp. MSP4-1]QHS24001.1 DUF1648 domain-containing protein [Virgibacillus sp. MSP4-1]